MRSGQGPHMLGSHGTAFQNTAEMPINSQKCPSAFYRKFLLNRPWVYFISGACCKTNIQTTFHAWVKSVNMFARHFFDQTSSPSYEIFKPECFQRCVATLLQQRLFFYKQLDFQSIIFSSITVCGLNWQKAIGFD